VLEPFVAMASNPIKVFSRKKSHLFAGNIHTFLPSNQTGLVVLLKPLPTPRPSHSQHPDHYWRAGHIENPVNGLYWLLLNIAHPRPCSILI